MTLTVKIKTTKKANKKNHIKTKQKPNLFIVFQNNLENRANIKHCSLLWSVYNMGCLLNSNSRIPLINSKTFSC